MSSISTSLEAPPPPLIEQFRSNHEEIERLEQLIMKVLDTSENLSPAKQMLQGHRLRSLTKSIILKTEQLIETYATFTDETEILDKQIETWTNVSSDFSHRLQQIHEYYRKQPCVQGLLNADEDYEAFLKDEPLIAFNEEEGFGRYLDLHAMYNQYINSSFGESVDYSAYLDLFSQPETIPRKLKFSRQYTKYMEALLEYLIYFFQRTEPLQDLDMILCKVETDFKDGKVESELIPSHDQTVVDRDYQNTVEEELKSINLCGNDSSDSCVEMQQSLMEAKVKKLCHLLDETIERTKQTKQEMEEENPLKQEALMGWDGKPIPYWLCKLGLGQEYKCEICSNYSYAGIRAFERHFKEWRHQVGLRRLGIPERVEWKFNGITLIEEAKEVWKKMKRPSRTRPPWRLEKIKDKEEAPAAVAIPPPNIKSKIERAARLVAVRGSECERNMKSIHGEDEELYFLKSSDDPYHAFYQQKLAEYKNQYATRILSIDAAKLDYLVVSDVPPLRVEAHKFTYTVLEGMIITHKDLDIMKLTAEFWVQYGGRRYFEGLSSDHDHELEFMNKPSDGRFFIFSRLVSAYLEVTHSSPKDMKEKLRKNAADIETVLENCYQRLQWERYHKEKRNAKEEEKPQSRISKKLMTMARPPPPQVEAAKKLKIDESELVPEKEFLAQHPGKAAINVHVIKPLELDFEILLPSLSETVASLKQRISAMLLVPASRHEFSGNTGLLKDNLSLAHYNVVSGDTLTLSLG